MWLCCHTGQNVHDIRLLATRIQPLRLFALFRYFPMGHTDNPPEILDFRTLLYLAGFLNAFQFQGTLPGDKEALAAVLDEITETAQEDDLRKYRVNLRHL